MEDSTFSKTREKYEAWKNRNLTKKIYFVRHAQSKFNVRTHRDIDPLIIDASLTSEGIKQAQELLNYPFDQPDEIWVSPLTRTLQTLKYGFNYSCPKFVDPRLREILVDSDDLGSSKDCLESNFPNCNFSRLSAQPWWYISTECQNQDNVCWIRTRYTEPEEEITERLSTLISDLESSPARTIICVTHAGIIRRLTGISAKNAQVIETEL